MSAQIRYEREDLSAVFMETLMAVERVAAFKQSVSVSVS
jgi:hypothetical protein